MLTHAPEERTLGILLRKTKARLREYAQHSGLDTLVGRGKATATTTTHEGVPLVLPFDKERRLMPRLLRHMRHRRFMRYRPDTLTEYAPLTPYSANYFMERLRTARIDQWHECVVSIWALGRLVADDPMRREAEDLLYGMLRTTGGDLAWNGAVRTKGSSLIWFDGQRLARCWKGVYSGMFLCVIAPILSFQSKPEPLFRMDFLSLVLLSGIWAFFLSLPATFIAFLASVPLDIRRMDRIRAMALLTLGRWREPRHLSLLLREFVEKHGRVHRAAEVALTEVLPLLEGTEDLEYAMDFVPNLCRALQRTERQMLGYTFREETLEILLLETLGKVGDGRAISTVERIARRGRTPRLQEVAQSILPILHARSRCSTNPRQLLRSSGQSEVSSRSLLRPAHHTTTPSHELLRSQPIASEAVPVQIQTHE